MSNAYWDFNYANWLYQYLKSEIGNDYGVSGLMGNLYAESTICPFMQQFMNYTQSQALTDTFRQNDKNYFVYYDGNTGYSLAQWTTYSRRSDYYDYIGGSAYIGDGTKSAQFLVHELQTSISYQPVWNTLANASSIREASNAVLFWYESPADKSIAVQNQRAEYSTNCYDDFSGSPPIARRLPIWLLAYLSNR